MSDFKTNPHHLLTAEQFDLAVKARIARENARKSTGPQTPEGKAASAANARKHGFAGARLILDDDEGEAFDAHLQAYMDCLLPENQIECDLVRRAAAAQWKIDQIATCEATIVELETSFQTPLVSATLDLAQIETRHYRAIAYQQQAAEPTLDHLNRYRTDAARDYDRAIRNLNRFRAQRAALEQLTEKKRNKAMANDGRTKAAA